MLIRLFSRKNPLKPSISPFLGETLLMNRQTSLNIMRDRHQSEASSVTLNEC